MTYDEFLEATGISDRTLRHYQKEGLVPSSLHPDGTVDWGDEHLLRVLAIRQLKEDGVHRLREMRARLDAMTLEELRQYVFPEEAPDSEPAPAPPVEAEPALPHAPPAAALPPPPVREIASAPATAIVEDWSRVRLRHGLELHLMRDAPDEARRLARAIVELCGVGSRD
jgi:Ca-activated chloride channel family protein